MNATVRLICFYLPQFHPIPENDRWWGRGFTEWTNVVKAKPVFPGHHQPQFPADLGFYDLRVSETREAQAEMAHEYGISGFCYYHYWFNGKRVLERPFNEVLASGRPDFPFCLCWANENWTRRWDGLDSEVLLQQRHSPDDDASFIRELFPAFRDRRYIRIGDRPLFIVYRTDLLPNPARTAEIWRREARQAGLPDLYLCRAETFTAYGNYIDPASIGFDAALEFPPHAILSNSLRSTLLLPGSDFRGEILDYEQVAINAMNRPKPAHRLFRGVMPAWDNTARMGSRAYIYANSSPEVYGQWLADCIGQAIRDNHGDERVVFINAWNEWAEGCHLEPDTHFGFRYLEATRDALREVVELSASLCSQPDIQGGRLVTGDILRDVISRASESRRDKVLHRLRQRERESGAARSAGQGKNGTPVPGDDISLRYLVIRYLSSDHQRFRRFRLWLLRVLQVLWRTARRAGVVR